MTVISGPPHVFKWQMIWEECHRYDFWYVFWNGLNFFELFKLLFSNGIDHDPHVFYVHMTYVYSFSYVSFFTRSHGQEKSLSYYDLFNFRVLFYGRIPTLISFSLFNHTPPILAIEILIIQAYLKKHMRQPRCMEKRKILSIRWRTVFGPH